MLLLSQFRRLLLNHNQPVSPSIEQLVGQSASQSLMQFVTRSDTRILVSQSIIQSVCMSVRHFSCEGGDAMTSTRLEFCASKCSSIVTESKYWRGLKHTRTCWQGSALCARGFAPPETKFIGRLLGCGVFYFFPFDADLSEKCPRLIVNWCH